MSVRERCIHDKYGQQLRFRIVFACEYFYKEHKIMCLTLFCVRLCIFINYLVDVVIVWIQCALYMCFFCICTEVSCCVLLWLYLWLFGDIKHVDFARVRHVVGFMMLNYYNCLSDITICRDFKVFKMYINQIRSFSLCSVE